MGYYLLMIGRTISHYKIVERLGAGGMGVVYRAEDERLQRSVAIKFLQPALLEEESVKVRFRREARAAAAIQHPGICTIHEIDEVGDETFIVMAYIAGRTLRDEIAESPLSVDRALDIAIGVADALGEAHARGIVHRDVKSANIILSARGAPVLTDFGLAMLPDHSRLTKTGGNVGTVAYMAPEQLTDGASDAGVDTWALGVCLYEMLVGTVPFAAAHESAVMYAIVNENNPRLTEKRTDAPKELDVIMDRALAKDRARRYATIVDFRQALIEIRGRLAGAAAIERVSEKDKPSVAVLPFVNMSSDPEQEYFCDGITEDIINHLTHLEGMRVTARTSTFAFKGQHDDIREIGRRLGVGTVVEGSVRKAGNRLRITAQLINVSDGYHLWSESYDRDFADVFAIQDEISLAIVENLRVKLVGGERELVVKRHTENLEAYNLYLKGRHLLALRHPARFKDAVSLFSQAVTVAPDFAPAHAELAYMYTRMERYSVSPPAEVLPKAMDAARKAVALDPNLPEAQTALGEVLMYHFEWDAAEAAFRHAIDLNPNYPVVHHAYGWFLSAMGRHDEALASLRRAQHLDPLSFIVNANVGSVLYFDRRYDEAIAQLRAVVDVEPSFAAGQQWLGRACEANGHHDEGIAAHRAALDTLDDAESAASLAHALAGAGDIEGARELAAQLLEMSQTQYVSPYWFALVDLGLGDHDSAITNLNKALTEKFDWLMFLAVEPMMDPIRHENGFAKICRTLNLKVSS